MPSQSKTNLTQKAKKHIFWETMRPDSKKIVFFVFPRKKMVLGRKTYFFIGKRWFWRRKPIFSQETDGFGKENQLFLRENKKTPKNIFWETCGQSSKLWFFWFSLGKSWFCPKPSFPGKKLFFLPKTIFFLGKSWFFCPKPSFS